MGQVRHRRRREGVADGASAMTPRTGRPRGRPRKPRPITLKRPRGRPVVSLQTHPNRHDLAALHSLIWSGMRERTAARALVAHWCELEISCRQSCCTISAPEPVLDFLDREADKLRAQLRCFRSDDDRRWLEQMQNAFIVANYYTAYIPNPGIARLIVMRYATMAGEAAFAQAFLLPLLDGVHTEAELPFVQICKSLDVMQDGVARFFDDLFSNPQN